ncbi:hypothetical protein Tco_1556929 [Tanacetum coccineum]
MNDPNMTMEEYIKFEEEKARRHGRVFDWHTATYGKIRFDDDLYDLRSMEAEFPAIIVNDAFEPQDALHCKSQVSTPVNDEIEFRISFDESDDEDYTIICDKNSFSYIMISVNDLKTNLENDYEKVMPLIPSPGPAISCFDDLDFFEDFENKFLAIVYNDAQTSKSNLLTEPILNHQHIVEFDDETSLPEYDEEEQNVLYFNDLFPFNIIRSDDLKSEKDNDNNEIDIIQSFEDNKSTHGSTTLFETSHVESTKNFRTGNFVMNLNVKIVIWIYYANEMLFYLIMNLCVPFGVPFDPKRYYKDGDCTIMLRMPSVFIYLIRRIHSQNRRFKFLYSCAFIVDFANMALPPRKQRHRFPRVQVVDFQGMPELVRDDLFARMVMEHRDEAGVVVFTSQAWGRLFGTRGPLVWELILEFLSTLRFSESKRMIPGKGDLHDYWRDISTDGDFLGPPPSYTLIRDPVLRLCHRMMAYSIVGRSQAPEKVTVTNLFYLRGLDVGSVNM